MVAGLVFVSPEDVAATPQCRPVEGESVRLVLDGRRIDGREVRADTDGFAFSVYAGSDTSVTFHTSTPGSRSWSQQFSLVEPGAATR